MSRLDEARYGRACLLLLNVCPFTLRKVIDDFYTKNGSSSLQDFLDKHKHDLFHLLCRSCCCRSGQSRVTLMNRSQWELLYDKNLLPCNKGHTGDCPCRYDAKSGRTTDIMDVTLCCLVIYNICPGVNISHIKTILEIRNKLVHSDNARLDQPTYYNYWNSVKTATVDLASHVSVTVYTETLNMIQELETRVMDPHELGELRKLILGQKKFAELEERVSKLERDHDNRSRTVKGVDERMTQIEGSVKKSVAQMEGSVKLRMAQMEGSVKQRVAQMEGSVKQRVAEMEGSVKQRTAHMEGNINKITQKVTQIEGGVKQKVLELEGKVNQKAAQMEKNMNQRAAQFRRNMNQRSTQMERNMNKRMTQMEGKVNQKVTEMEGRVNQIEGKKITHLEHVVGKQGQEIQQLREEQFKASRDILPGEGPDISLLRKRLIEINDETTQDIPLSPVQEGGDEEMPIELLYASVVIREDPKYARKGHNSSQRKRADQGDNETIEVFSTSALERIHQKQNISMTPDFDIGSYSYDSHSDSDIASTSDNSDEFLMRYDQLSPIFGFPDAVSGHTREMTNPDDILKKDDKVARNIYMLGDAAHGKTTYCLWLLKKWCSAQRNDMGSKELDKWEKALHEFDFVFLLQFRYVNQNLASVIDMICQGVFHMDTGYHAAIHHVLSSDKYRSLIIMDGLDEWNPYEETRKQLTCKAMPNIPVSSSVSCFFSMRPWVFPLIKKVEACDRVIEILGLSKTGMKKVIENVLLNRYKLKDNPSKYRATYDKIVRHLKEKSLKSFMQIPLLAVVCVQIWYKEKQVGDSMTSFYAVMVDMLIERAHEKHELKTIHDKTVDCKLPQILSEKENIANHISALLTLGKVAYEGLLSNETNLVFQKRKLQKKIGVEDLQFALDVGLISQTEAPSLTTKNVSVHFFHKSIQEFLAVIYIVTEKEVSDLFCKHLSSVNVIMELSNVIMFICGMCPSLGRVISQCVVSVTDSDTEICKYREFTWDLGKELVEELYKLQISWYREIQYGQTDSSGTQTDSPVTQTDSPVTQTDSSVTQTDSPVTQTDKPVTQTDSPVTQTDSPVTFHVSDVYLDNNSDTEKVRVTRELLSDHHVDIRSLLLWRVPTDGECGITNSVLCDFLSNTHRTRSLVWLCIIADTDRSVPTICVPSLRCLYLYNVTINTHLGVNVCPPLLTDTSLLRVLWLLAVTLGEGGLGVSPDMVHIERIKLWDMTLGEGGLGLSPNMVHIEKVELWYVKMPAAGWGEFVRSVSDIQHRFDVVLHNTNIDVVSVTKIRSSPDFTITQDGVDDDGEYELHFTRVWPSSQLTQGNVLLYTRLSPLS